MPRIEGNVLLSLYKYRSLAEPHGRGTAVDVLSHNRMWWQSPLDFNDPFDCNPVLVFGRNGAERRRFAKRAIANNMRGAPRHPRLAAARGLLRRSVRQHEADMRAGFREWMAESAVTCFSEVRDCPLMWAHYADSHRGICFVFREQLEPDPWVAFEVTYSAERPRVNYTGPNETDVVEQGILHKSADWSYEKEYRMLEYRRKPGYRSFPGAALAGVIYGARISDGDREFMDGLIDQRGGLERYQASIDDRFFRVNINPT